MHIHDLYAGRSPYRNIPAPRNMNPVRTFTTVEDLLYRINSRIKQGRVTEHNAFSMLLAFINESCPRKKNLDQGRPILVFDKDLWATYVKNRVAPSGTGGALIAQSIINVGEQFFYLGFETGMWRAPDEERKTQAKKAALDLASMAGISPDEMKMRFPSLINWINDGDDENASETSMDGYGRKSFVPLYDQNTHLFFDIRLGLSNLQHNPEVIREYVKYLRPITGRETKSKTLVESQDRATVETLVRSNLIDVIDVEERDEGRQIITYTCPIKSENREPLMAAPTFPIRELSRPDSNENKEEEGKENTESEANPAPESVIVF